MDPNSSDLVDVDHVDLLVTAAVPLVWTEDTEPRTAVMLDVLPEGSMDPELDPCAAPADEVRSCSRQTLPDGDTDRDR